MVINSAQRLLADACGYFVVRCADSNNSCFLGPVPRRLFHSAEGIEMLLYGTRFPSDSTRKSLNRDDDENTCRYRQLKRGAIKVCLRSMRRGLIGSVPRCMQHRCHVACSIDATLNLPRHRRDRGNLLCSLSPALAGHVLLCSCIREGKHGGCAGLAHASTLAIYSPTGS